MFVKAPSVKNLSRLEEDALMAVYALDFQEGRLASFETISEYLKHLEKAAYKEKRAKFSPFKTRFMDALVGPEGTFSRIGVMSLGRAMDSLQRKGLIDWAPRVAYIWYFAPHRYKAYGVTKPAGMLNVHNILRKRRIRDFGDEIPRTPVEVAPVPVSIVTGGAVHVQVSVPVRAKDPTVIRPR